MEKRLILVIAISLLILLSWSQLVPKYYHVENKRVIEKISQPPKPSIPPPAPETRVSSAAQPLVKLLHNHSEIVWAENQAALQELIFKEYQSYKFALKYGFLWPDKNLTFKKESQNANGIVFLHSDPDKRIIKRFSFSNSKYHIMLEIEIQNLSRQSLRLKIPLVLGVLNFAQNQEQARFQDMAVALQDKVLHINGRKNMSFADVKFLSLRDRYFCAILEPVSGKYAGFIQKINPQESEVSCESPEIIIKPGENTVEKFNIYLGPQDLQTINRINKHWSAVVNYGFFDIISQGLLQLLEILHTWVRNWGIAIILLSLLIYILLYPLTLKQMRSMKEMQVLQPRIESLRKAHKDNPQKLNKEIMELYRQHKVNPFGGCIPLILQIPVFFALYQALMRSIALKGAAFLWIKDLSEPDRLFLLPVSIPVLGNEINILPILMTIGMFIQQKFTMSSQATGSAEQQKIMMIIFPLMFGLLFYHMPAGLVLYWFINSSLMLIYQFRISRIK